MTFDIRAYQLPFMWMIGLLMLLLAVTFVVALSLVCRVLFSRMENTVRTLRGRMDGGTSPIKAFGRHKRLAIISLVLTVSIMLMILAMLGDCRMNIVNDSIDDVLTVTGRVEAIERRSLLDGTIPFFTEDGLTFGVRVIVNGEEYHMLSDAGLAAGESVTLQYLSASRFVLYVGSGSELPYLAITPQESMATAHAAMEAVPPVTAMTFPFEDYRRVVMFEVGLFLMIIVILVRTLILSYKNMMQHKMSASNALKTALFLLAGAMLLQGGCSSVRNGGWQLLFESSADAVSVRGEIQSIEALDSYDGVKFSTEWGTQFGCYVTIDGTEYFAMYEGDLTAGDTAQVIYLPQSRYILSISANEE